MVLSIVGFLYIWCNSSSPSGENLVIQALSISDLSKIDKLISDGENDQMYGYGDIINIENNTSLHTIFSDSNS